MKKRFSTVGIVVAIALLTCIASSVAADSTRIDVTNLPPGGVLELEIGETYTFDIEIKHGPEFILAMAMPDVYYPGRAVEWHGPDLANHETSATLALPMTGKGSTDEFAAVCDWPEPGVCWEEGTVPASIVVGVRFKNGEVISERFDFAVVVH